MLGWEGTDGTRGRRPLALCRLRQIGGCKKDPRAGIRQSFGEDVHQIRARPLVCLASETAALGVHADEEIGHSIECCRAERCGTP